MLLNLPTRLCGFNVYDITVWWFVHIRPGNLKVHQKMFRFNTVYFIYILFFVWNNFFVLLYIFCVSVADQEQRASRAKKPSSPKKNKKRVADFCPQKAPEQCSEFIKSVVKGMQIKINAEALLTKKEKRKNWLKISFINLCNYHFFFYWSFLITDKSNDY